MNGIPFIITGPSGVGKTSIIKKVLEKFEDFTFSVSYTTRPKRKGEKEGTDYYFVSDEKFKEMVKTGELLEWAEVHGYMYGTSSSFVKGKVENGISVILDIDVQGGLNVLKKIDDIVSIFISPPSFEVLKERLIKRGTEKNEDISRRLSDAKWELSHLSDFHYVVVNKSIQQASKSIESIIIAEQLKTDRVKDRLGIEEMSIEEE
ncbi:MAG: guanylate kinase [Thermotogota bacterium]|nr:guanylate kinase [Thermotogota bacterium]